MFDPGGAFALSEKRRRGGIETVFVLHGSSADAVIAKRVRRSRNPRDWLVVTSDRNLAETVARQEARVRSAEDFARELSALRDRSPDWKDVPPSAEEVETWLSLFEARD